MNIVTVHSTSQQVFDYLKSLNLLDHTFTDVAPIFMDECIDGKVFLSLEKRDLSSLGIFQFSRRNLFYEHLKSLRMNQQIEHQLSTKSKSQTANADADALVKAKLDALIENEKDKIPAIINLPNNKNTADHQLQPIQSTVPSHPSNDHQLQSMQHQLPPPPPPQIQSVPLNPAANPFNPFTTSPVHRWYHPIDPRQHLSVANHTVTPMDPPGTGGISATNTVNISTRSMNGINANNTNTIDSTVHSLHTFSSMNSTPPPPPRLPPPPPRDLVDKTYSECTKINHELIKFPGFLMGIIPGRQPKLKILMPISDVLAFNRYAADYRSKFNHHGTNPDIRCLGWDHLQILPFEAIIERNMGRYGDFQGYILDERTMVPFKSLLVFTFSFVRGQIVAAKVMTVVAKVNKVNDKGIWMYSQLRIQWDANRKLGSRTRSPTAMITGTGTSERTTNCSSRDATSFSTTIDRLRPKATEFQFLDGLEFILHKQANSNKASYMVQNQRPIGESLHSGQHVHCALKLSWDQGKGRKKGGRNRLKHPPQVYVQIWNVHYVHNRPRRRYITNKWEGDYGSGSTAGNEKRRRGIKRKRNWKGKKRNSKGRNWKTSRWSLNLNDRTKIKLEMEDGEIEEVAIRETMKEGEGTKVTVRNVGNKRNGVNGNESDSANIDENGMESMNECDHQCETTDISMGSVQPQNSCLQQMGMEMDEDMDMEMDSDPIESDQDFLVPLPIDHKEEKEQPITTEVKEGTDIEVEKKGEEMSGNEQLDIALSVLEELIPIWEVKDDPENQETKENAGNAGNGKKKEDFAMEEEDRNEENTAQIVRKSEEEKEYMVQPDFEFDNVDFRPYKRQKLLSPVPEENSPIP